VVCKENMYWHLIICLLDHALHWRARVEAPVMIFSQFGGNRMNGWEERWTTNPLLFPNFGIMGKKMRGARLLEYTKTFGVIGTMFWSKLQLHVQSISNKMYWITMWVEEWPQGITILNPHFRWRWKKNLCFFVNNHVHYSVILDVIIDKKTQVVFFDVT